MSELNCQKGCGVKITLPDSIVSAIEMKDIMPMAAHFHCPPPGDVYAVSIKIFLKAGGLTGNSEDKLVAAVDPPYEIRVSESGNVREAITGAMNDKWSDLMSMLIKRDESEYRLDQQKQQSEADAAPQSQPVITTGTE